MCTKAFEKIFLHKKKGITQKQPYVKYPFLFQIKERGIQIDVYKLSVNIFTTLL